LKLNTRKQKHHLGGNAAPAGYCHTSTDAAGGVNVITATSDSYEKIRKFNLL